MRPQKGKKHLRGSSLWKEPPQEISNSIETLSAGLRVTWPFAELKQQSICIISHSNKPSLFVLNLVCFSAASRVQVKVKQYLAHVSRDFWELKWRKEREPFHWIFRMVFWPSMESAQDKDYALLRVVTKSPNGMSLVSFIDIFCVHKLGAVEPIRVRPWSFSRPWHRSAHIERLAKYFPALLTPCSVFTVLHCLHLPSTSETRSPRSIFCQGSQ